MRIEALQLSWFRGAADQVSLELNCKSMVVYGLNGSGKSSFVDAIEYVLHKGKIGHLSHEYSGMRQEKAVPNRHRTQDQQTEFSIKFEGAAKLKIQISQDGSFTSTGAESVAMGRIRKLGEAGHRGERGHGARYGVPFQDRSESTGGRSSWKHRAC